MKGLHMQFEIPAFPPELFLDYCNQLFGGALIAGHKEIKHACFSESCSFSLRDTNILFMCQDKNKKEKETQSVGSFWNQGATINQMLLH